jgi:hypothetical protein
MIQANRADNDHYPATEEISEMLDPQMIGLQGYLMTPELNYADQGVRAVRNAHKVYQRICATACLRRLMGRVLGRETGLLNLETEKARYTVMGCHDGGLQTVEIRRIVGSECRTRDFDSDFHPVGGKLKERWVSVAVARQMGTLLPPVALVQMGDGYYVRDGHHRISVARRLGEEFIEAEVTVWEVRGQPEAVGTPRLATLRAA